MTRHSYSGSAINVTIENTYTYQNKEYDDFSEISDVLGFNLLTAKDLTLYVKKDVKGTLDYAVELAKGFVDTQHPAGISGKYQTTHNLSQSIRAEMETSTGANGGRLVADAKDPRGRPYAGHMEYGYTDRGGNPRGPWPFLRPAMRLALSATRANFADTIAREILNLGDANLTIGSRDAASNLRSAFGSQMNAINTVRQGYQSFETKHYGTGQGRWDNAYNGIGFASGNSWGSTASGWNWDTGEL